MPDYVSSTLLLKTILQNIPQINNNNIVHKIKTPIYK